MSATAMRLTPGQCIEPDPEQIQKVNFPHEPYRESNPRPPNSAPIEHPWATMVVNRTGHFRGRLFCTQTKYKLTFTLNTRQVQGGSIINLSSKNSILEINTKKIDRAHDET